jgi:glucan phosphoethanolaminetransferase (alkaline phosphatase superfamily)
MDFSRKGFLALAALLSAPYLVTGSWLLSHHGWPSCTSYLSLAFGGIVLLAILVRRTRYFLLLHLPVFVLSGVITAYILVCDQLPGKALAMVLETSSWDEMRGFLGIWQGQKWLLLLVAASLCYVLLAFSIPTRASLHEHARSLHVAFVACLAFLAVAATASPAELFEGVSATPVAGTIMFITGPLSSADYTLHSQVERKRPYGASHTAQHEVHILVIGESSRRDSWSIYGYSRPTTPCLKSLESEIVFFTDAHSDANATIYAVPILLTGIAPESFTFTSSTGNLVDLAKEAGYFSVWLANQDPSPSYVVGVQADVTHYTQLPNRNAYIIYQPDEVLLPELQRQMARRDTPLFIAMHVYGSHAPYANRFPRSFAHFAGHTDGLTSSSAIDTYDDTILYTDWLLAQVIERTRKFGVPATVTYLSDHGEELPELDGRSGHGAGDYSPHAFEIPAFVWMNEAYRRAHPEKVAALTLNASKPTRTHDFFYTLADLMGARWPSFVPQRSLASPAFLPDTTEKYIAGGKLVAEQSAPQFRRGPS